jgi:hypothetical protein
VRKLRAHAVRNLVDLIKGKEIFRGYFSGVHKPCFLGKITGLLNYNMSQNM